MIKLGAQGLRVLLNSIESRPAETRGILQAAAVAAHRGSADPELVAGVSGQPAGLAEQVLDRERRLGSILTPGASGYRFQHDNWIDVLISSCPPATLRSLHARCLALLRPDPAAEPRRLAWHAIRAGSSHVAKEDIATLARRAADLDIAAYAFSTAARMYEVAARHASGADQVDLMIRGSDALRLCGRWQEARELLHKAASLAATLGIPECETSALIHLERLTWSYGLKERELTQRLRDVISSLQPGGRCCARKTGQHGDAAEHLTTSIRE